MTQGARERMWPAPTAADWKRPVLIRFQRSWEDAKALSRETGKPILICVNMDGEIASEHYAGIRYREAEKAKLYEPYVCVIASVYRHTPRDYDEHGHRILCPRFGSVTCGEHIRIEPKLYAKFFDGKRIAPRHIMVELDGKESYDVYYAFDTDSVFKAIREGITKRPQKPKPIAKGDRSVFERVASRDSKDRDFVEKAFLEGKPELRKKLIEAASKSIGTAPSDLLRLAVFGFDPELAKMAREALAKATDPSATLVINEALRVSMGKKDQEALIAALERIGKTDSTARRLAAVHKGLGTTQGTLSVSEWNEGLAGAEYPARPALGELYADVDRKERAAHEAAKSPEQQLELAEATLRLAEEAPARSGTRFGPSTLRDRRKLLFTDALTAAEAAKQLGADGWRLEAAFALAKKGLGKLDEAYEHAANAVGGLPKGETSRRSKDLLELFAHGRQYQIIDAIKQRRRWPREWLADLHAAYGLLARHPLGEVQNVVDHYDFLRWLRAGGQAARCLSEGLTRFPNAPLLHDRLRGRLLREQGAQGLESWYAKRCAQDAPSAQLLWHAGYSSMVAAEYLRRAGKGVEAEGAYDRAISYFERARKGDKTLNDDARHFRAVALGGKARIALEDGRLETALEHVLASFKVREASAATLDGLNLSTVDTAKMLLSKLRAEDKKDEAKRLDNALSALDPKLLELPAYERAPGSSGQRGGRRRNPRGNGQGQPRRRR